MYQKKQQNFGADDDFNLNDPVSAYDFKQGARIESGRKEEGDPTGDNTIGLNGTLGIGGGIAPVAGNMTVDDSMQELVGQINDKKQQSQEFQRQPDPPKVYESKDSTKKKDPHPSGTSATLMGASVNQPTTLKQSSEKKV